MKQTVAWKGFLLGVAVTLLLAALTAGVVAQTRSRQATLQYPGITIKLNGTELTPTDVDGNTVEPFIIDGTTYLPIRAVAEAGGMDVSWDADTYTVLLSSRKASALSFIHLPAYPTVNTSIQGAYTTSGTGDQTLKNLTFSGPQAVRVSFSGEGAFALNLLDTKTGDVTQLASALDAYAGTVLIPSAGTYDLQVTADGYWSVDINPPKTTGLTSFYGSGDMVTELCNTDKTSWKLTYTGSGSITVNQWSSGGSVCRQLLSQTGPASVTVNSDLTGSTFFQVCADGAWIITAE